MYAIIRQELRFNIYFIECMTCWLMTLVDVLVDDVPTLSAALVTCVEFVFISTLRNYFRSFV